MRLANGVSNKRRIARRKERECEKGNKVGWISSEGEGRNERERKLEQPLLKSVPRATSCARWSHGIIRYATATARLLQALLNLVMNAH